jgi:exodeoxyribonuclease V gamma subunit
LDKSKEFTQKVKNEIGNQQLLPPLDIDLTIRKFRLYGRLTEIWPHRMCRFRCAKQKAKDLVRLWIEHLVLNAADADQYPETSKLIMADRTTSFKPVEDPIAILGQLLELYQLGLTKPLPFFPESSFAYITGRPPCDPANAIKKWEDGFNSTGEKQDPYFRVCFGKADPFDEEFDKVTRCVLEPLLRYRGDDKK